MTGVQELPELQKLQNEAHRQSNECGRLQYPLPFESGNFILQFLHF
jgi:hypothetical protein